MNRVFSQDGTSIAFDPTGQGRPLILVDGAPCSRAFGPMPQLAPLLAQHCTVYHYDRRGRNDSGDTAPYAVEREIESAKPAASRFRCKYSLALMLSGTRASLPTKDRSTRGSQAS